MEGPTDDVEIRGLRQRQKRNLLATLLARTRWRKVVRAALNASGLSWSLA